MGVHFEELSTPQRAGGVEAATRELVAHLVESGVSVTRSSNPSGRVDGALPDCVHVHGIWAPYLARRSAFWRKQGVPCVVSPHGMLEPWALAHKGWKKRIAWKIYQRRILNGAGLLHATSEGEAKQFSRLGLKTPCRVIPWGVKVPDDLEQNPEEDAIKTMLFVGRIYPVKGLPMLVEAWDRVRPVGWRVKLVGPDEAGHRGEVEALISQYGLEDVFEFVGELAGVAKENAYRDADLFVLPSHSENFGMVVGEALARGVPVITTQGTPWEDLETERCGWWVPASVDGLAEVLGQLASCRTGELQEMGKRGRNWMKRSFDWDDIAAQMREMYESLVIS